VADEREISIVIKGKNLTAAEFAEARKGLAGLGDETDRTRKRLKDAGADLGAFGQSWKQLTASFTAANLITDAVHGVIDMGKAAVKSASDLVDLSNKTGASIAFLQRAGFVARQTGSNLDQFTTALFKLGTNIATGSDAVKQGLSSIGLEWDKIRRLRPEQQWELIVAALNKVPQPQERNRIALEIFGKTAANVLPGIVEGYGRLAAEAPVSSDAQIRALDAAADAWDRMKDRAQNAVVGALGSLALLAERTAERGVLGTAAEAAQLAWENKAKFLLQGPQGVVAGLIATTLAEKELDRAEKDRAQTTTEQAIPATITYAAQLAAARKELAALTPDTQKQIRAGIDLGQNTKAIAAEFTISEAAVSLYKKSLDQATSATKKAGDEAARTEERYQAWKRSQLGLSDAHRDRGPRAHHARPAGHAWRARRHHQPDVRRHQAAPPAHARPAARVAIEDRHARGYCELPVGRPDRREGPGLRRPVAGGAP